MGCWRKPSFRHSCHTRSHPHGQGPRCLFFRILTFHSRVLFTKNKIQSLSLFIHPPERLLFSAIHARIYEGGLGEYKSASWKMRGLWIFRRSEEQEKNTEWSYSKNVFFVGAFFPGFSVKARCEKPQIQYVSNYGVWCAHGAVGFFSEIKRNCRENWVHRGYVATKAYSNLLLNKFHLRTHIVQGLELSAVEFFLAEEKFVAVRPFPVFRRLHWVVNTEFLRSGKSQIHHGWIAWARVASMPISVCKSETEDTNWVWNQII